MSCTALTPTQITKQNWKNLSVKNVLNRIDNNHDHESKKRIITIIPFYKITSLRYDMHVGNFLSRKDALDCTHFCLSAPLLWSPVWLFIAQHLTHL